MEVLTLETKTFQDSIASFLDKHFPQEGIDGSRPLFERLIWQQSLEGWNDAITLLRLQQEVMGINTHHLYHDLPSIAAALCLIAGIRININYRDIIQEESYKLQIHAETPFAEVIRIINLLGRAISMQDLYPQELLIQRLILLVKYGTEGWKDYICVNGNSRDEFISWSLLYEPIFTVKQVLLQTILNTFPQFLSRRGFDPYYLTHQFKSLVSFLLEFHDTPLRELIFRNRGLLFMLYPPDITLETDNPERLAKCLLKIARFGHLQDRSQAARVLLYLRNKHQNPRLGMGWLEILMREYLRCFTS